jgi:hypothetical protein
MSARRLSVLVAIASAVFIGYSFHTGASGVHNVGDAARLILDYGLKRNSQQALTPSGEQQKQKGLTVIGAGFSRTGTKSIERGLQQLGHRVYDIRSMMQHGHTDRWIQAAEDWKVRGDLKQVETLLEEMEAEGYTATLDMPMNLFALAFSELRPKAKVLFSVRDNEEKWIFSFQAFAHIMGPLRSCRPWVWIFPNLDSVMKLLNTILDFDTEVMVFPTHLSRPLPWFEEIHTNPMDSPEKQQAWIEMHKKFQKELKANLPRDRLLVYNVKQGWAPLIPFLGIEDTALAKEDFPRINDLDTLMLVRKVMDLIAFALPVWILMLLWILTRVLHAGIRLKMAIDNRKTKVKSE